MRALLGITGLLLVVCAGCAGPTAAHQPAERFSELVHLALRLTDLDHLHEAQVIVDEGIRLGRALPDPDPYNLSMALHIRGHLASELGQPRLALQLLNEALPLTKRYEGGEATAGEIWESIGMAHYKLGQMKPAESALRRAEDILRRAVGPGHPRYGSTLLNLAYVLSDLARFDEALTLNRRALAVFEKTEGPDDVTTAAALNNLAQLYIELDQHQQALPLLERSLRIAIQQLGDHHPNTAICLNNLADLYADQGDLIKAKVTYLQALAILEGSLGKDHPSVAFVLNNLGWALHRLGDFRGSLRVHERAREIRERVLGPTHPDLGVTLQNQAAALVALGEWERAQPLFLRALRIQEKALGQAHPNVAGSRVGLAKILISNGRYGQAERQLRSALAVTRNSLGPRSERAGQILVILGEAVTRRGSLARGRAFTEQGLAILREVVGDDHDLTATALEELAYNALAMDEPARARALMEEVVDIQERITGTLLGALSERARIALLSSRRQSLDLVLSLFDQPGDTPWTYGRIFRWKGAATSSMLAQRLGSLAAGDEGLHKDIQALREVREALAGRLYRIGGAREKTGSAEELTSLRRRKEALERSLAGRSRAFALAQRERRADWRQVCTGLGSDKALVDFFRYRPMTDRQTSGTQGALRLAAFVLHAEACERPLRVELGDYRSIEASIVHLRRLLAAAASRPRIKRQARRLYRRLWAPMEEALGGRRWVWLATTGALANLPFGLLMDGDGRPLVDGSTFSYLSAGRDLAQAEPLTDLAKGALVIGDVGYGRPAEPDPGGDAEPHPLGDLFPVPQLPATRAEADAVAASLRGWAGPVERLDGPDASEENFTRRAAGRRVIHLATHGFFATGRLGDGMFGPNASTVLSFNPMVMSGILLAGVNRSREAWASEDGLLTAEEVAGLDLRGCELVVLSACDTGLGKVEYGEGVMGLRRGFAMAGARSVVMSLWKVSDEETRCLMEYFYRRLAADPQGDKAAALRKAKLALRDRLEAERGWADPRAWAGFVISGR